MKNKYLLCMLAILTSALYHAKAYPDAPMCSQYENPNLDFSVITNDLQIRIQALQTLKAYLSETRLQLMAASTNEAAAALMLNSANDIKLYSSIFFVVAGIAVESPSALAFLTGKDIVDTLISAINASNNKQPEKDLLLSWGLPRAIKIGESWTAETGAKKLAVAWKSLGSAYSLFQTFADYFQTAENSIPSGFGSQINSIDKQLVALTKNIAVLEKNLLKTKSKIEKFEPQAEKKFVNLLQKAAKKQQNLCEAENPNGSGNNQEKFFEYLIGSWVETVDAACALDAVNKELILNPDGTYVLNSNKTESGQWELVTPSGWPGNWDALSINWYDALNKKFPIMLRETGGIKYLDIMGCRLIKN